MAQKSYTTEEKDKIAKTIGAFTQSKEALATERLSTFIGYLSNDDVKQLDDLAVFLATHAKYYDNDKIKNILAPITMNEEFNRGYFNMIISRISSTIPRWKDIAEGERNKTTPPQKEKQDVYTASLSENIDEAKQTKINPIQKKSTQPLVRLLSRIESRNDSEYATNMAITEDKDNGEKITFNKKEFLIGDNSSITYTSKDKKVKNTIIIDKEKENNIILSHKKNSPVLDKLVSDGIFATVDYMTEKGQIPFVFNINAKSKEYLTSVIKTLYGFSKGTIKNIKNPTDKKIRTHFFDNVVAFKFKNIEIPKDELLKLETEEEFLKKIEELNKKAENKKNTENENATKILEQKMKNTSSTDYEELIKNKIKQR